MTVLLAGTGCKDKVACLPTIRSVDCPECSSRYLPPQTAAHLIEPLNRRPR